MLTHSSRKVLSSFGTRKWKKFPLSISFSDALLEALWNHNRKYFYFHRHTFFISSFFYLRHNVSIYLIAYVEDIHLWIFFVAFIISAVCEFFIVSLVFWGGEILWTFFSNLNLTSASEAGVESGSMISVVQIVLS
jgi:hypothetical protein